MPAQYIAASEGHDEVEQRQRLEGRERRQEPGKKSERVECQRLRFRIERKTAEYGRHQGESPGVQPSLRPVQHRYDRERLIVEVERVAWPHDAAVASEERYGHGGADQRQAQPCARNREGGPFQR